MIYEATLPNETNIAVSQDGLHIATKARNLLLNEKKLPMGTHSVSIEHLRKLLTSVHKSVHWLSYMDVYPTDRMNYTSFEKLVQDRAINALKENVPDSDATVQYLETFRDIVNSFTKYDLKPLDRIKLLWRGVFFLRFWRRYIDSSRTYTLSENFLTSNIYMCVEINAKCLIRMMKLFRDRNTPEMFLPTLFDSQTCERIFRLFRSMSTTQYTKINFSLLELIHTIGRIEVLNDIAYSKLNIDGVEFPNKRNKKTTIYKLPTDEKIEETIKHAKEEAFKSAIQFGICDPDEIDTISCFEFKSKLRIDNNDGKEEEEVMVENEYSFNEDADHMNDHVYNDHYDIIHSEENTTPDILEAQNKSEEMNIFDHDQDHDPQNEEPSEELDGEHEVHDGYFDELDAEIQAEISDFQLCSTVEDINEKSPLMYITDVSGNKKCMRKSTFIWMITETTEKSSNDRTRRFVLGSEKDSKHRKRPRPI